MPKGRLAHQRDAIKLLDLWKPRLDLFHPVCTRKGEKKIAFIMGVLDKVGCLDKLDCRCRPRKEAVEVTYRRTPCASHVEDCL